MRKNFAVLLAWACLFASGCGEKMPKPAAKTDSPHGGLLYNLPNAKGTAEIVAEPATNQSGASKRNSHLFVVYFYQVDGLTPLATPPTNVAVDVGESTPISLKPEEGGEKAGRFVSAPGPYGGEVRGTLSATVDGERVEVPITKR